MIERTEQQVQALENPEATPPLIKPHRPPPPNPLKREHHPRGGTQTRRAGKHRVEDITRELVSNHNLPYFRHSACTNG